jgi:hypothetical protein
MPKFPLQSVLEHRKRVEEERQIQAALANLRVSQAEAGVTLAQSRLMAVLATIDVLKLSPSVDGYALSSGEAARARAQAELEAARAQLDAARQAAEAARAAATAAGQDRLSVEKLRDSFMLAMRRQAEHAEEERLGEMSLARWRQRSLQKGGSNA